MTALEEKIQLLCFYNLIIQSPVLSGNMQSMIKLGYTGDGFAIMIDAPFYDQKEFRKNGNIVHTGEVKKGGIIAYANWVNEVGAFGRHNKSEHWVNRVLNDCCMIIAASIGATVINELPL